MIVGWFTRLVVALAVLGVAGYDTVSIVASHLSARDDADAAAGAAAAYVAQDRTGWSRAGAVSAADSGLSSGEAVVPGTVRVAPDGDVTLTVHRVVTGRTLVAHHLGFLHRVLSFDTTSTGSAPQS